MATGGVYDELSDIITCQICFELMDGRRPRTLSCFHIFCEDCLQHLLDEALFKNPSNSGKICCPVCTQTTKVPGGSSSNLPVFFYASKVQDVRKEIEARHTTCRMCKSATHKADISSYCFSCTYGYCEDCRVKHDTLYTNHPQISLSPATFNFIICSEHDTHLSHFCMTCANAICSQCYMSQHVEHKVYDLSYDGKNIHDDLKEFLLSSLKSMKEKMQNLLKLEAKFDNDMKKAMEEMTQHRDHLMKQVNDQYKSMCLELNKKQDDIKHDLMRSKQLVEDARLCIEKSLKQTESWQEPVKGISEARIVNSEELIADIKQQLPPADIDIKRHTIRFVSGDDDIELGKIVDEDVGVTVDPTLMYEIETKDYIRDIDYLDNGHLVVCMSKGVCVYNEQSLVSDHYLTVHCKASDSDGLLCSVCVCKKTGKVVVSEYTGRPTPGYLHVYRPYGDRWQYDRYQVCERPLGVSVTSSGYYVVSVVVYGVVAGSVSDVYRLYKYNSGGQQLWSVDVSRNGDVKDVFVGDDDVIFVCHQNEVVIYDNNCKQMSTLSTTDRQIKPRGHQMSTLSTTDRQVEPLGVFVNKKGEIFVSDYKSRSVLLFNKYLCFVKSLIHLDFVPKKLCLYENRRLSVCDSKKVCVYKV